MFAVAVFYMYFTNILRNINATNIYFCCVRYFGWFGKGAVAGDVGMDGMDGMKHDGSAGRRQGNKARGAGFIGPWYWDHPARDPPPPDGSGKTGGPSISTYRYI